MCDQLEPIAIIGIGCRFPGGAHDLDSLWQILLKGRNTWTDVPPNRYNWRSFSHPSRGADSAHTHRGGHFLDGDIAAFDAGFFGVSALEAEAMDPQQRIQVEVAYEALENAGIPLENVKGSNTGVYVATFAHDYENMMYKDPISLPKYGMTGVGHAIVSNRISYIFDLRGPSMTLDTGCSGGLVSLHQACQSLRMGETDMNLVGGTNLILSPDTLIPMDSLHLLNSEGKCFPFDSRGSGYGRGEGVAMVVLKRLGDAVEARDPIRAIIRNTAVGQDGKTAGITMPNGFAQQNLINSAYLSANLSPEDVDYVEAHGTGTVAGDVTELDALGRVFCNRRRRPLYIGSIKGNLGHLESTSGLAGLIKTVLVLEKKLIPSTPNLETLKPQLNLSWNFKFPRALEAWPTGSVRRASINSFGYGGVNAHAIIEAPRDIHASMTTDRKEQKYLFVVTAKSMQSLVTMLHNLRTWHAGQERFANSLADLAYTLASRRTIMHWRYAFVAATPQDVSDSLDHKALRTTRIAHYARVILIFTGQGAQWCGMAKELIASSSVVVQSLSRSEAILKRLGATWSLLEELSRDKLTTRIYESEIGQPATTAIQISLVDLLRSLTIRPHAILGHSSGEIAAAYAAGGLTMENAIRISFHRGLLTSTCRSLIGTQGAMLAVGLPEQDLGSYLSRISAGRVVIACSNSPSNTTVSGDEYAISQLQELFEQHSVAARRLKVDTAYHSHHMQAVAGTYLKNLNGLGCEVIDSSARLYSSVTGDVSSNLDCYYWVENLTSKVRFCDALQTMCQHLYKESQNESLLSRYVFLELGPHGALSGAINESVAHLRLDSFQHSYVSAFSRNHDSQSSFLRCLGHLFEQGVAVNLERANSLDGATAQYSVIPSLTPYPWDHSTSYWYESRISREHRFRPCPYHDLLGVRHTGLTALEPTWRHIISTERLPWLKDHAVDGVLIFPGAGYITMAIEAKRQIDNERYGAQDIQSYMIRDVEFSKLLEVPDSSDGVEAQLCLRPSGDTSDRLVSDWEEFRVFSITANGATFKHCCGHIMAKLTPEPNEFEAPLNSSADLHAAHSEVERLRHTQEMHNPKIDTAHIYDEMRALGHHWGSDFSLIKDIKFGQLVTTGNVVITNIADSMPGKFVQPHVIHPTTLDALFHSSLILYARAFNRGIMFPIRIGELEISTAIVRSPGDSIDFVTTIEPQSPFSIKMNVSAFQTSSSSEPQLCLRLVGGELRGTTNLDSASKGNYSTRDLCHEIEWSIDIDLCAPPSISNHEMADPAQGSAPEARLEILNASALQFVDTCLRQISEDNVKQRHVEMYAWMKRYRDIKKAQILNTKADVEHNLAQCRSAGSEGVALSRIGFNLKAILTGEMDPLSLLLEDDLLSEVYADNASFRRCYSHLTDYMKHLTFKNPGLRVIEIGAGTGGATLPLLQSLGDDECLHLRCYDFTDVSAGFFENARLKLSKWDDLLRYKPLDISKDPVSQGFTENSYDIVLACNALHVTGSIEDAIANARKLLSSNGRLILIEITEFIPFINLIFGALPGWYMGRTDGRNDSPLMPINEWRSRLSQGSFSGIDFVAADYDGPARRAALIVSKPVPASMTSSHLLSSLGVVHILHGLDTIELETLQSELFETLRTSVSEILVEKLPIHSFAGHDTYIVLDNGRSPLLVFDDQIVRQCIMRLLQTGTNVLWLMFSEPDSPQQTTTIQPVSDLARAAQAENQQLKLVTLEIREAIEHGLLHDRIRSLIADILLKSFFAPSGQSSSERDYIFDQGAIIIPRLKPSSRTNRWMRQLTDSQAQPESFHQDDKTLKPNTETPSILESPYFVHDEAPAPDLAPSEIDIQVEALALDHEEVISTSDHTKATRPTIREFAGFVTSVGSALQSQYKSGDQVCAWGAIAYANHVRVNGNNAHILPHTMTPTVGASLPVAFLTAYYALVNLATLRRGETILIHAAASSIGQAALQICQHIGAALIVTVASTIERRHIMDSYAITENRIFSSKTPSYQSGVQHLTKGLGVDVVLDLSSGQYLSETLDCMGLFGRLICTKKLSPHSQTYVNRKLLDKNITFTSVDLATVCKHKPAITSTIMQKVMSLFKDNQLIPISPIMAMPLEDLEDVLIRCRDNTLFGKIILETPQDTIVKAVPVRPPSLELNKNGTYVVAGDVTELTLTVCRYLVTRGASYVMLVSWTRVGLEQEKALETEFTKLGITGSVVFAGSLDYQLSNDAIRSLPTGWPPVHGIIQFDVSARENSHEITSLTEDSDALQINTSRAHILSNRFWGPHLRSVVMISTAFGLGGHVGCVYTNRKAARSPATTNFREGPPRFVCLNIGGLRLSGFMDVKAKLQKILLPQGLLPAKSEEFFALLDYAIRQGEGEVFSEHIFTGFDKQSLAGCESRQAFEHPRFAHLTWADIQREERPAVTPAKVNEETLEDAMTPADARRIVVSALQHKISTFVTMDHDMIDVSIPIEDFGLDSLIMFRMRNWTYQNFKADLNANEISDAASIMVLTTMILERSSYKTWRRQGEMTVAHPMQAIAKLDKKETRKPSQRVTNFPRQPLQSLEKSLKSFRDTVQSICSKEELERVDQAVREFDIPGGIGRRLHNRLSCRAQDPKIDNWLGDFYAARRYLRLRSPLVACQSYFGTHPLGPQSYSPAERATLIVATVYEFMQRLESGRLESQYLGGQMIDPECYLGLFSSCREPHIREDMIRKYPSSDHITVFRFGHAFKIKLRQNGGNVSPALWMAAFEKILSLPKEMSWTTVLTTDERNRWAETRDGLIQISDENKNSIQDIEKAAFVICLDHARPQTPSDRFRQFLFSDGSNRWYDKTLQFVVCDNGISASVMEHSVLDGIAVEPIHRHLNRAIMAYTPGSISTTNVNNLDHMILEELSLVAPPAASELVTELREKLKKTTSKYSFATLEVTTLSNTFLRSYKCASQSSVQVAIQLACRRFFGHSPPALETVSMAHFRKGRVDVNYTVRPALIRFLDATTTDIPSSAAALRPLFHDAAKEHAISLSRTSKGRGFSRHLLAMEWMLEDGEQAPTLFSEPAYARSKAGEVKLLTSCFTTGWLEGGFIYPAPGGILVYFEIKDQSVNFSVFGNDTDAVRFGELLEDATRDVHDILDEGRT